MARPKGSRNKNPALTPRYNPNYKKSQFANAKMADTLYAELKTAGLLRFHKVKDKYATIFNEGYFCLMGFEHSWKRLLKKVAELHGDDRFLLLNKQREQYAKQAARKAELARQRAAKPYRRNLKNPPVV